MPGPVHRPRSQTTSEGGREDLWSGQVQGVQVRHGRLTEPAFDAIVEGELRDGVHRNPDVTGRPEWFTLAYFHTPEGLCDEVRAAGFPDANVFAVEGLGAGVDLDHALDDPAARAALLRAIARVEREPSLLGASPHLLAIGTRT